MHPRETSREANPVLLVLNKHEDTLACVDSGGYAILSKIRTGHDPHEMAITPDGRFAYISNYAPPGDTVSVVDLVAKEHVLQIRTGRYVRIHGAAMAPDGRHVYFTAGQTGFVVEIDTETNAVSRAIPTHGRISHMVVISPDGRKLYTANIESRTVSVMDVASGGLLAQVPCDRRCEGLTFTPNGKFLWAANQNAGNITIIRVEDNTVAETLPCPGIPLRIKFTSDGRRALVTSWEERGELVVLDVPGHEETGRIGVGNQPIGVEISPGEDRAFVTNMSSDEIHIIDLHELRVMGRFTTGKAPDAIAWWWPEEGWR